MDKQKILVVDDESRMRKLVRDFLVRQDYDVLEAGNGEEALDLFYFTDYPGCDDAPHDGVGGMPGDSGEFQGADYYADSQGGRKRRTAGL